MTPRHPGLQELPQTGSFFLLSGGKADITKRFNEKTVSGSTAQSASEAFRFVAGHALVVKGSITHHGNVFQAN